MSVNKTEVRKTIVFFASMIACTCFGIKWGWPVGVGLFFSIPYITTQIRRLSKEEV